MRIITAEDEFNYAAWHILNEIKKKSLPYPSKKVFDYMEDIDTKHKASFLFGMERDAIQFLKNKKVIKEIGEPDIAELGEKGTHRYKVYEVHHFKILNKFDEFYRKYTNLLRGGLNITQLFGFRGMIFWLKLVDGDEASINFSPRRDEKHPAQPYYLFRVFIETIKGGRWKQKGNWIEISMARGEIISEVKKLHHPDPSRLNSYWIGNTRNNLINKTIPKNLKKLIKFDCYDRKSRTYTFSLKIPL